MKKFVEIALGIVTSVGGFLEIGSIAERVEVAAQSLQLNTVEASPGQVIEKQRIVEMRSEQRQRMNGD